MCVCVRACACVCCRRAAGPDWNVMRGCTTLPHKTQRKALVRAPPALPLPLSSSARPIRYFPHFISSVPPPPSYIPGSGLPGSLQHGVADPGWYARHAVQRTAAVAAPAATNRLAQCVCTLPPQRPRRRRRTAPRRGWPRPAARKRNKHGHLRAQNLYFASAATRADGRWRTLVQKLFAARGRRPGGREGRREKEGETGGPQR